MTDIRLISNKGFCFELLLNLISGFNFNTSIRSLRDFVFMYSEQLNRLRYHNLENLFIETILDHLTQFESMKLTRLNEIISVLDILLFTVLSICIDNMKMMTLSALIELFVKIIQKKETDHLVGKKLYDQRSRFWIL